MAKFEMSSSVFMIPEEVDNHYSKEELEAAKSMYAANDYEEGIDTPVSYNEKHKYSAESNKETDRKIAEFKKQKIGKSALEYFSSLLAA
jgi:hypothetical protein